MSPPHLCSWILPKHRWRTRISVSCLSAGAPAFRHPLHPLDCIKGRGELQSSCTNISVLPGHEIDTMIQHIQGLSKHNKQMPRNRRMPSRTYSLFSCICFASHSKWAGIMQEDKEAFLSLQHDVHSWVTSGGCLLAWCPLPCLDSSCILLVSRCGYLMHAHLCPQPHTVSA